MNLSSENKNQSYIVFYSTLFLILTEFILLKISTQLFFFLSHLPIIFLCLILRPKQIFSSLVLTLAFLVIFKNFSISNFINYRDIFFLSFVSIISFSFSFLNYYQRNNSLKSGKVISLFILILGFILITFVMFYYKNLDHSVLIANLSELIKKFNTESIYYSALDLEQMASLVINILPSVNFLIITTVFMINFKLALIICRSLKFEPNFEFNIEQCYLEKYYTYIFFIIIFLNLFNFLEIQILTINLLILLSSGYIVEGYKTIRIYFDKLNISSFLKILIIFLLFLFLGYVLLLIIFFIGLYQNIKRLIFRI